MGNGLDQTRRVALYVLLMLPQNQSMLGAILNQIVAQELVGKAWLLSTKKHMHIDSYCFTLFPWHEVKNHQKKLNQVYL